jgi:hypothetical protein
VTNLLYDDKNWTKIYTLNYGVGVKPIIDFIIPA